MWRSCSWYQKQTGTCAVSLLNGRTTGSMHTVWWWGAFWTCVVMTLKLQHCSKHNVIAVKASRKVNSSSVLHELSAKLDKSFEADYNLLVIFCSEWSVVHPMFVHYVLEHSAYWECLRSALWDEYLDLRGRKCLGSGGNSYNEKCHGLCCAPSM